MRTKQRQTRQPPKTNKQNTSDPSGSDVLQSIRRETYNIGPHSSGRWNRYVHGSSTGRQDPTRAIPVMPTTIPDGMWRNTCNSQQHCPTIRPGRLHHLLAQNGGNSNGQQHSSETITWQAQGSVERFHRTLMGQVRAIKLQLENNYGIKLNSKHPIMTWLVKHSAYLLNRYSIHSEGNTSYYRRWGKKHKTPICEFGETVLYMLPTAKHMPKMEARFYPAIWLGKDTSTNENIIGISNKVVKARTIRRQIKPDKYNKQLMDTINSSPAMIPVTVTAPSIVVLPQPAARKQQATTSTETQQSPQPTVTGQPQNTPPLALTDLPMATAPATQQAKQPLPMPTPAWQARSNRRDSTRQPTKASKNNSKSNSSQQTRNSSGATDNKNKDIKSHSHNNERTEDI